MNGIRRREVARRVFAYELNRSTYRFPREDEKSPTYVLTPLGVRVNRIFLVGALLDKEEIKPDSGIWRIRVSDPTSAVYGYIGRFQPDALESLMEIDVPELVAIVGKVRTFEVGARIFVSIRPEYIAPVESEVRDYWVYETAKHTIERIKAIEEDVGKRIRGVELTLDFRELIRSIHPVSWIWKHIRDVDFVGQYLTVEVKGEIGAFVGQRGLHVRFLDAVIRKLMGVGVRAVEV